MPISEQQLDVILQRHDDEVADVIKDLRAWREIARHLTTDGDPDCITVREDGGVDSLMLSLIVTLRYTRTARDAALSHVGKPTAFVGIDTANSDNKAVVFYACKKAMEEPNDV
jgi:hypothetical protein